MTPKAGRTHRLRTRDSHVVQPRGRRTMRKLAVLIVALLTTTSAFAGSGIATIDRYFVDVDGYVYFGTIGTPLPATCSYFIEQFRFNGTTPAGKNMLATLMAAKV